MSDTYKYENWHIRSDYSTIGNKKEELDDLQSMTPFEGKVLKNLTSTYFNIISTNKSWK